MHTFQESWLYQGHEQRRITHVSTLEREREKERKGQAIKPSPIVVVSQTRRTAANGDERSIQG
jgi:hypothetical protein